MLDGSASSDPDVGTVLSYQWSLAGSPIAAASTSPTLTTNLPDGVHNLLLTVTDDSGDSATDSSSATVTITVNAAMLPTANAGTDLAVPETDGEAGELVTLTGSATDPDGTITSYEWLLGQTSLGFGATLRTRLADGVNVVTLRVTDNAGNTATDTVQITVAAPPEAVALSELPNLTPEQQKAAIVVDRV